MQRLAVATLFFSLLGAAGPVCAADATPLRPVGDGTSVIRISALRVLRWQAGGKTLLDLQGNAEISQGHDRILAPRLMAWFSGSAQTGGPVGLLDVYAEKKAKLFADGQTTVLAQPALFRLTAAGGLVLAGEQVAAGEPPAPDRFRLRAMTLHGDVAAGAPGAGVNEALGEMHPSAERTTWSGNESGFTVTLIGNAAIFTRDMTLLADVLRIRVRFRAAHHGSPQMQSIYAEGSVDFRRGDVHLTCEQLCIDGITDQGLAVAARVRTRVPLPPIPIQFAAAAIREQSLYRFTTEGEAYITTSTLADPALKLESKQMQVVLGGQAPGAPESAAANPAQPEAQLQPEAAAARRSVVVSASDDTVDIEDLPVFYWPYFAKDVRNGTFLLKGADFGSGGYYGNFLKLQWDLYDLGIYRNDWSSLTLKTDAFSERGFGDGLEFDYKEAARYGLARMYYIQDHADWDDDGLPRAREDRGEATWRDRELLGDGWTADLELGYLSDRRFLYVYDPRQLDQDMDRQTGAFVSHVSDNTMLAAESVRQINDFQNVLERDSAGYHVIGEPISDTGFLWTTHTDLAELRTRYDQATGLPVQPWTDRLDSAHELSYPLQLGFIRAEPFAWGDATAYNAEANSDNSSVRGATAVGARASANFYRAFDVQSSLFEVDRLRHIMTPTVEYGDLFYVSNPPSDYVQNDEIDALDETEYVTFGLLNRLQTYRQTDAGRKLVELLRLDVKYHVNIHGNAYNGVRGDFLTADQGVSPFPNDFIEANAKWLVNENIELSTNDDEYNVDRNRLEAVNGTVTLNYWQPFKVSFIQMYYLDPTDQDGSWHCISLVDFSYQPRYSRWRWDINWGHDFLAENRAGQLRDPRNLQGSVYLTRNMDGWDFSIGTEFDQGTGNSTSVLFRITPPGAPPPYPMARNPI